MVIARHDRDELFVLQVSDTGIGIPAGELEHVLEPFSQVDANFTRQHEGTGLGLPLCRTMAELHGGHLEIESALGAGTIVTIRFPRDRVLMPGQELSVLASGLRF
jgi:signal transduction histidine kinase